MQGNCFKITGLLFAHFEFLPIFVVPNKPRMRAVEQRLMLIMTNGLFLCPLKRHIKDIL